MRRIVAVVEVDSQEREMTFFTNNLEWAASSICDLYKVRWNIETFFKQIKQTLHLGDFLGHSRKAIEWQVWTALLMYVLLRFPTHLRRLGAQLYPAVHLSASRAVAASRPARLPSILWDSRWQHPHAMGAAAGISCLVSDDKPTVQWDSIRPILKQGDKNPQKSRMTYDEVDTTDP